MRRLIATGLGVAAAALASAAPAAAHTHLVSSLPSDSATVRTAPRSVVLRFNQKVDPRHAQVRVLNGQGARLASTVRIGAPSTRVVATLRKPLANGFYAIGFRVASQDGHVVGGGFVFTVKASRSVVAAPSTARRRALLGEATPSGPAWTGPMLVAARAGQYTALVLGLGGLVFLLAAWWPALGSAAVRRAADPLSERWLRVLLAAATVGVLSAVMGAVAHAHEVALTDRAGLLWLEGVICWVVAGGLLLAPAPLYGSRLQPLLGVLCAALVAVAVSGHAGADGDVATVAGAIVHGLAVSIWIGAIAWLALAAGAHRDAQVRPAILMGAADRVSRLALVAAVTTLVSGAVQAILLAGGPAALPSSGYGRLVLFKLALFGLLVGLGAVQRGRSLPRLRRAGLGPHVAAGRALRVTLRAELVLAAAVLTAAGLLAGSAPPPQV